MFKNLVFEGGGVKGIAYAGALKVLEEKGITSGIKRTAGTSAGAITAAIVALGAKADDVQDILSNTDFRKFMDDSFGVVRDTNRLLSEFGWYKSEAFSTWMQKIVYSFTGNPNLTFGDLNGLADNRADGKYKELFVVTTNLTMQMPQVFSAEHSPNVPIWKAVRMSMSIPLFFAAIRHEKDLYVDGGLTWNYPLDIFDDIKYLSDRAHSISVRGQYPTTYDDNHAYNKETLGFRVDTLDEIKAEKDSWRSPPRRIEDFFDYAAALGGFMLDMSSKMHLHKNDWDRTIFIDAGGVGTTEFDISDAKLKMLVANGQNGATKYFSWFDDPTNTPINR